MSALENPKLEEQLDIISVMTLLYRAGAFSFEVAIQVKNYASYVGGIVGGIDRGLIQREIPSEPLHNPNDFPEGTSLFYLTSQGKIFVDSILEGFQN